jgi:hypothetical protein
VRTWLDNNRVSVRNDPSDTCYFRFRIEINGKNMTVLRLKDESMGYVQVLSDLGTHGDNKSFEHLNDAEIEQAMWNIKVDLARAQVGYSGLVYPPDSFTIFRKVPIHHNLTEFIFMSCVGGVEAAINLIGLMLIKTMSDASRRVKDAPVVTPQPIADSPRLKS